MNRGWRTALAAVTMLCVIFAAMAGSAMAKPVKSKPKGKNVPAGTLDSSFGKGGKVTMEFPAENAGSAGPKYELPFEFAPGHLEMAAAPGDKTVVAGATKIVRYLANGKLDQSFGSGGVVSVPRPSGTVFVLAGVAVDSQGRILLAGLTRPLPTNSTPDPLLSSAAVLRYNANGTPDTTFGNGGIEITDFGIGAPKAEGGPYRGASVGLRDITIDSLNRPVVTGAYVTQIGDRSDSAVSTGFVARLTESGAPDQTFGEKGVRPLETIATIGQVLPHSSGFLALASGSEGRSNLLAGIDENGNIDSTFGSFGFRTVPFREAPNVTIAPSGKILLLGRPQGSHIYRHVKRKNKKTGKVENVKVRHNIRVQTVQRLLPSGAADPGFGRVGRINYTDPAAGSLAALAVDNQERIYLVGRIGKRVSKAAHNPLHRTQFLIERTGSEGNYDHTFGKEGVITTGFGGPADSFATQVMLDKKGRIEVGGGITSPELATGGGFAIARYLPGS
jgi:uncharacterized delta-60 repeat protein